MKHITKLFFLTITILLSLSFTTSKDNKPKKLNVKGEYKHLKTGIIFPVDFENYKRESITSFNKENSNIGVSYYLDNSDRDIYFTIYIYPAPVAIEHRIRDEYFDCLQSIANVTKKGIDVSQKPIKLSKNGYKLLGLSALINQNNLNTHLILFECGKYFIKYRISSSKVDTSRLIDVSNKLIERFSPIDIVKQCPLILGSTIHISPGIMTDTASLDAVLVGVLAKIKWVNDNVDSLERCSGFPSLYFDEQKIAIDSMLNKWENLKHSNSMFDNFFNDLLKIRKSGYLNEYIFDEFGGILFLPNGLVLHLDNYEKWKRLNNPTVHLTGQYYYLIGFEESYKDEK